MATTLPPDHYAALGVSKTADAAAIKAAYRKLVLKCHPDKVTDETLKQQKREEFDKIQQAYEIIGDEDKRAKYDKEVEMEERRKERLARGGGDPRVEIRTASYDIRMAAPAGASSKERGPSRYEERSKSSRYDDDAYFDNRSSSRKYDTYESYSKRSSPRTSRSEKEIPVRVKVSSDRSRSDLKKSRDQAERRERSTKFVVLEDDYSSPDERIRFETDYRRRDAHKQDTLAAEPRRHAEEPRKHRESRDEHGRKLSEMEHSAKSYMASTKTVPVEPRPSTSRTSSSRDVRPDYYEKSSRRPEPVRRSSARPKDLSSGRERERRVLIPEIVEWEEETRVPAFKHSSSSPAEIHVPRMAPQRSYTEASSRQHRRSETSPPPMFRRSETMPHSSSRRPEAVPVRPSTLRTSETVLPHDSGYSSPGTPEGAYPTIPSVKKVYHYPSGGIRLSPEEASPSNGRRTVLREPERQRARSPSPISRPPIGSNRVSQSSSSRQPPAAPIPPPAGAAFPPPLSRAATMNVNAGRTEIRDRGRKLYGEVSPEYSRENARRQTSFSPERVSYAPRIGPDDIRWSRGREPMERPPMRRQPTVY